MSVTLGLAQKSSRNSGPGPAALIGVSVFREPGFAVPGAEVQLTAARDGSARSKVKPVRGATSARGELVFRVAPAPMDYDVAVSAKRLKSQHKSVSVHGEERVDVTFMLEPESK